VTHLTDPAILPDTRPPAAPSSAVGASAWRNVVARLTVPRTAAAGLAWLTVLGLLLRLFRLDQPSLAYDEAATYSRVTGTFRELLDVLRYDGFAPLHYEVYWLLARVTTLTPAMMRIVPALAGTAMIPAVYFLARQLAGRRVALLAAAITCTSAWMLVYSRDAKMYMPLWLCATVFVACLLWWLRTGRRVAWLAWAAAGAAMNGLHALGLVVVGVSVAIVLAHPLFTWRRFGLAAAGWAVASAGLAGHYVFFNQFAQKVRTEGWHESGLVWIAQRNAGLTRPFLVWDVAASHLLAYRAPRPPVTPPRRVAVPVTVVSSVLIALWIAAMLPWRRSLRDDDVDAGPPETRGRIGPWLAAWIVLPVYAFYCVSFPDARSPPGVAQAILSPLLGWNALWLPVAAAVLLVAWRRGWGLAVAAATLPVLVVAPLTLSILRQSLERVPSAVERWLAAATPGAAAAALVVALAWCAGRTIDLQFRRAYRPAAVGVALIVAVATGIWLVAGGRGTDVFNARYFGVIWPAVAVVAAILTLRLPAIPLRHLAAALLIGANLLQYGLRVTTEHDAPLERFAADVATSQDRISEIRTLALLLENDRESGLGGAGGAYDLPGKYYLSLATGRTLSPPQLRTEDVRQHFRIDADPRPRALRALVRHPRTAKLVVWRDGPARRERDDDEEEGDADGNTATGTAPAAPDPILAVLSEGGWALTETTGYVVQDFWCWRKVYRSHRLVYERPPIDIDALKRAASTTAPATSPPAP
jgi:4-amino-4-deoxy-L-arabinose transferase-like glycosyltransferase